jgi:hypothetical protein
MSNTTAYLLLAFAILIVMALSVYAISLIIKVIKQNGQIKTLKAEHELKQRDLELKAKEKDEYIRHSLAVLASSLKDKQITPAEASIRIAGLLDFLPLSDYNGSAASVFFEMRDQTQHIPKLAEFNALEPKERQDYFEEISKIEAQYAEQLPYAIESLMKDFPLDNALFSEAI